jgi:trehalose 6-phosphate synthase/phosphatase
VSAGPVRPGRAPPSAPEAGERARPLVVVSNRLPFVAERKGATLHLKPSPGGLVAALDPVLRRRGGVWVGWAGATREEIETAGGLDLPEAKGVRYHEVRLSAHEVVQYYGGFSNRTLWPLFHYFVGHTRIDGGTWAVYERVNERFAEVAAAASPEDALVWIHDYQLLRAAYHLRRLEPQRRIALFLHIPFPAADVFRVLPWSRSLMQGMLAADLVGLHVPSYVQHFLSCAEQLLGCEVDPGAGTVRFEGREVSVQAHPLGADAAWIEELAGRARPASLARPPDRLWEILGVDRLDYTKGIHERLLAIERLLERHPRYRRRILFTQVLVPSRERVVEYTALKRQIDEAVGRINGRFSERGWSPVRYLVRQLPREELVPLYRAADVALVTPLRDGMNLVAKEYVAAQLENDGVLILSEMAGAADELQEALLVNPFDVEAVAEALHRGLSMSEDERRARMSALRDRVRTHDVHAWVEAFLAAGDRASDRARSSVALPVEQIRHRLAPWLAQRPTVALFLDYDGTLTPLVRRPEHAKLSDAARELLQQAARTPNLDTVVVSGRSLEDVKGMVGVPGLTYVGDHGFEIEGPGIAFRHEAADRRRQALEEAARELDAIAKGGAWVERKGATLAFHVREVSAADQPAAQHQAEGILRAHRLRVTVGKMVVEGRPAVDWHKGRAVLYVLHHRHGSDWPSRVRALYLGDDTTDEDAFRSLLGIGRSVRVASGPTTAPSAADFYLPDPDAVLQLLRWLAAGAFAPPPA